MKLLNNKLQLALIVILVLSLSINVYNCTGRDSDIKSRSQIDSLNYVNNHLKRVIDSLDNKLEEEAFRYDSIRDSIDSLEFRYNDINDKYDFIRDSVRYLDADESILFLSRELGFNN